MKVEQKPSVDEVERVFAIVEELTKAQFPFPEEKWWEKLITKSGNVVTSHSSFVIVILTAMGVIGGVLRDGQILQFSVAGFVLIAVIAIGLIVAWIPIPLAMFWRMRKDPYCVFLELVKNRLPFIANYLERLADCDPVALKLVRETYAIERRQYQERGESLSGAVSKFGIFPGVAGAIILGAQLKSAFGFGNWIVSMVALILIFHVINFSMTKKLHQMDRVITVLDLTIDQASE